MFQSANLHGRRMRIRMSRFINEEVRYTSKDLEKEYHESCSPTKNEDFFRKFMINSEQMRPFTPTLRLIYHDLLAKDPKITKINYFDLAEGFNRFSFFDFQLMILVENKLKERKYLSRKEFIKLLAFLNAYLIPINSISLKMTELFDLIHNEQIWKDHTRTQVQDEEELRKARELRMLEEVNKKKESEEQLIIKEEQEQTIQGDSLLFRISVKEDQINKKEKKRTNEEELQQQRELECRNEEEDWEMDEQDEEINLILDQLRIQSVTGKKNSLGFKMMEFVKKWCDGLEPKGESLGRCVKVWNKIEESFEIEESLMRCVLGKIDFLIIWMVSRQSEEGFEYECWLRDGWQILIRYF